MSWSYIVEMRHTRANEFIGLLNQYINRRRESVGRDFLGTEPWWLAAQDILTGLLRAGGYSSLVETCSLPDDASASAHVEYRRTRAELVVLIASARV